MMVKPAFEVCSRVLSHPPELRPSRRARKGEKERSRGGEGARPSSVPGWGASPPEVRLQSALKSVLDDARLRRPSL